jgi:Arc/MetJ-type ribon-helix-helix transcriptional regulator
MAEHIVILRLNQQQFELLDATVARGEARDREALVRRALREFAAAHDAPAAPDQAADD